MPARQGSFLPSVFRRSVTTVILAVLVPVFGRAQEAAAPPAAASCVNVLLKVSGPGFRSSNILQGNMRVVRASLDRCALLLERRFEVEPFTPDATLRE
jgi:hypothetical protein